MRPSQAISPDKKTGEQLLFPPQNGAESVIMIHEPSRRHRKWRIRALVLHACLSFLVFTSLLQDRVKSFFMSPSVTNVCIFGSFNCSLITVSVRMRSLQIQIGPFILTSLLESVHSGPRVLSHPAETSLLLWLTSSSPFLPKLICSCHGVSLPVVSVFNTGVIGVMSTSQWRHPTGYQKPWILSTSAW